MCNKCLKILRFNYVALLCCLFIATTMSQVFDKYSDAVGHLIMTEDGAITNVS